jgi:hypothetical protein
MEFCKVCGITRINGVFHWSHGNTPTTPENVAGLVCNNIRKDPEKWSACINQKKGDNTGDSFAKRCPHNNFSSTEDWLDTARSITPNNPE